MQSKGKSDKKLDTKDIQIMKQGYVETCVLEWCQRWKKRYIVLYIKIVALNIRQTIQQKRYKEQSTYCLPI